MSQGQQAFYLEAGSKEQTLRQKLPLPCICPLCTLLQFVLPKHHNHDSLCPKMVGIHPSGEYKQYFVGHHMHLLVCAQNVYDTRDTPSFLRFASGRNGSFSTSESGMTNLHF